MTDKQYLTVILLICGAIAAYGLVIGFSLVELIVIAALAHVIPTYGPRMIEWFENLNQREGRSVSDDSKTEERR